MQQYANAKTAVVRSGRRWMLTAIDSVFREAIHGDSFLALAGTKRVDTDLPHANQNG